MGRRSRIWREKLITGLKIKDDRIGCSFFNSPVKRWFISPSLLPATTHTYICSLARARTHTHHQTYMSAKIRARKPLIHRLEGCVKVYYSHLSIYTLLLPSCFPRCEFLSLFLSLHAFICVCVCVSVLFLIFLSPKHWSHHGLYIKSVLLLSMMINDEHPDIHPRVHFSFVQDHISSYPR